MAKHNPQQEQADLREARKKVRERASQRHAEFHTSKEHEPVAEQAKMTAILLISEFRTRNPECKDRFQIPNPAFRAGEKGCRRRAS